MNGIDVQSPRRTEHDAISFGFAPGRVTCGVILCKVRFGLNDDSRERLSAQNANKDDKSNVFKGKISSNEKVDMIGFIVCT